MLRLLDEIFSPFGTTKTFTLNFQYLIEIYSFSIMVHLTEVQRSQAIALLLEGQCQHQVMHISVTCPMLSKDRKGC